PVPYRVRGSGLSLGGAPENRRSWTVDNRGPVSGGPPWRTPRHLAERDGARTGERAGPGEPVAQDARADKVMPLWASGDRAARNSVEALIGVEGRPPRTGARRRAAASVSTHRTSRKRHRAEAA